MVIASRLEKFTEDAIEHYEEETLLDEILARRDFDDGEDADREFFQIGQRVNLPKRFFQDESYHNAHVSKEFARSVTVGERNFVLRSVNEIPQTGTAVIDEFTYEQLTDVFDSMANATHAFIPLYFHNTVHEWLSEDRLEFGTGITYVKTDGSNVRVHWLPDKTGFKNIFLLDSERAEIVQKRFGDMPRMDQFEVLQEYQFNQDEDRLMVYYGDIDDEEFDFFIRTLISDPVVDETSACVVDTSATGIELDRDAE